MSSTPQNDRRPPDPTDGLPGDLEAERIVLAAVLIDADTHLASVRALHPSDFILFKHQIIFRRILDLAADGETVDRVTLAEELKRHRELDSVDGVSYLVSLDSDMPRLPHIGAYVSIIKDKAIRRRFIHGADVLAKRALLPGEDTGTIVSEGIELFEGLRNQNGDSSGWPAPLPIGSELPPVEPFDPLMLPEGLRVFVEDIAERMQVPLDYPAACLIVAIAGAISRRGRIQPKARDGSFVLIPNLWGGIIGPPGFLKSPVLQAITAPLHAQEALWRMTYQADLESYETQREEADLRLAAWKEQAKAAHKKKEGPPIRPDTSIAEPTLRRLVTGDSTFEKLHELMVENPAGLLVIRDELTGWWSGLDREGRQGEREFYLTAWNGDSPATIDRIGRGSIHVPACCLSMLGGITPGRLRSYLADALQDGPSNDGLIQRFQVLVWPDAPRDWRYVDRPPVRNQIVTGMFERILGWDVDLPAEFRFDPEAQEFYRDWSCELEGKIRGDDLHPALISHLAKYRKLMPALSLILATADQVLTIGTLHDPALAFLDDAQRSARWCSYLESHAKRVYSAVVTPVMQAAADLAAKLRAGAVGTGGRFAVRDIYRHCWSRLDTPERVTAALSVLEDAGWVRGKKNESGPGRPPNLYDVNPRLR